MSTDRKQIAALSEQLKRKQQHVIPKQINAKPSSYEPLERMQRELDRLNLKEGSDE